MTTMTKTGKRGRPRICPEGASRVSFSLADRHVAHVDAWAAQLGVSRSAALRTMLAVLPATPGKAVRP